MSKSLRLVVAALSIVVVTGMTGAARVGATSGPGGAGSMSMGTGVGMVSIPVNAGAYRLTLAIGPLQPMYTPAQYRSRHPRSGEIMLRGAMVMGRMGMGMGMGMPNRHLELHVMNRQTMGAVSNAMVSISYQPVVGMGQMAIRPVQVPVALMMGIGMGMSDVHYGNNVYMPRGTYHVMARVDNVFVTYTVRLM